MLKRKNTEDIYYTNRHSCFLLQYHLVLVTKFRKPVIGGDLETRLYALLRETFEMKGLNILEIDGEPDHVHILFEADPNVKLSELINSVKTRTSRLIRSEFTEELKPYYWEPYFWSYSYFLGTVSEVSLKAVADYIRNQKD